jgi:hypothetical protein
MHACSKIIHPHCSSSPSYFSLFRTSHSRPFFVLPLFNKSFARNQKPISTNTVVQSSKMPKILIFMTKLTHIIKQKAKEYQPSPHAESSWYSGA